MCSSTRAFQLNNMVRLSLCQYVWLDYVMAHASLPQHVQQARVMLEQRELSRKRGSGVGLEFGQNGGFMLLFE